MRTCYLICLIIILLIFTGCTQQSTAPKNVSTPTDTVSLYTYNSRGQLEQTSYKKNPQRVVAVWQNSIETLIALGVGEHIVAAIGIPDPNYLKPEHRTIYEQIPYKNNLNLDLENALLLQPDLIVAWQSSFSEKLLRNTDFWHSRGINTYISNLPSAGMAQHSMLEKEYNYIMDMGKIFDRQLIANSIIQSIQQQINSANQQKHDIVNKLRVLVIELYGREISVYGKNSLAGELVEKLGGELALDTKRTSFEHIRAVNPDVIFLVTIESQYGREHLILDDLKKHPALKNLLCIQNNRIYTIPLYTVYCAGVRLADSIQTFKQGMYPDLHED